ncbi:MAG: hypothetical protein KatS3mg068_0507 [Candidatus Sericytochromatia bacterium]|nr:MAG: hypothetical protein KatS3mg068_0507 [Candidatus Sericytochromatia bacterium]
MFIRLILIIIFNLLIINNANSNKLFQEIENNINKSNLSQKDKNLLKRDINILDYQINSLIKELYYSNKEVIFLKQKIKSLNNKTIESNILIEKNKVDKEIYFFLISFVIIFILIIFLINYYFYIKLNTNIKNEKLLIAHIFNDYNNHIKSKQIDLITELNNQIDKLINDFLSKNIDLLDKNIDSFKIEISNYFNREHYNFTKNIDKEILSNNNSIIFKLDKAVNFMKNKEYMNAINLLEEIILSNPKFVGAYINLGVCYQNINNFDKSKKKLLKSNRARTKLLQSIF